MNLEKEEIQKICTVIKRALKNNGLEIYYQPIYNNATGKYHSAEALIRCNDPEYGYISPERLIMVAEWHGYVDRVTDIVYESVCRFISKNKLSTYGIDYIEINLSPENCKQNDISARFARIREKYGVPVSMINLEITETSSIHEDVTIMDNLIAIANQGTELSIDDYGTGYATMSHLIKVPVSIVKIDKCILWSAMQDDTACFLLKNMISIITELGKRIVVEGVETKEMVDFLTEINNNLSYQGFYYSKPITGHHFIKFLKRANYRLV